MTHFSKRTIAGFLAAILIASMILALPLTAYASETGDGTGVYEGEYDANGKRSGYGTWAYHNYLYEGFWANDMPSGEGTLYGHAVMENDGWPVLKKTIVQGNWVDGFADGPIKETWVHSLSNVSIFCYDVRNGCTTSDEPIMAEPGSMFYAFNYGKDALVAAVPPWCPSLADSTIPAPLPTFEYDTDINNAYIATFTFEEPAQSIDDDGTGVYEGEYDADGKRSGYGVWAYHNFLYMGNWENDLPNGKGTLYYQKESTIYGGEGDQSHEVDKDIFYTVLHGNWMNGYASGTVERMYFTHKAESWPNPIERYRVNDVQYGYVTAYQMASRIGRGRDYQPFERGEFIGAVAPFYVSNQRPVDPTIGAPWNLTETYPPAWFEYTVPKHENTGMSISPGNLANSWGWGLNITTLGDWIFLSAHKNNGIAIYRMRPDGSHMIELYDSGQTHFSTYFHVIGDWLYVGAKTPYDSSAEPYKMQADDVEFTSALYDNFDGLVVDGWEYLGDTYFNGKRSSVRINLDNTQTELLGNLEELDYTAYVRDAIFADEDWLYLYWFDEETGAQELTKVKTDGSGKMERHPTGTYDLMLGQDLGQIVGGRLFYTDLHQTSPSEHEKRLYSVDLDFSGAPVTVVRPEKDHNLNAIHVTDDYIYYSDANIIDFYQGGRNKKMSSSITRINHDGSNPTVLADGFQGVIISNISIAGDWMMLQDYDGGWSKSNNVYLMRLDGSDLHKLGEAFIPSDAPGIMDSSEKWRYEVLYDGSAAILGPGVKLKQSGKLSIPAMLDGTPVTAIGDGAFYGCDGFTSVSIPKGVTSIGDNAFFWCKGLTGATIPEGVTNIGEGAFQYCVKLKKLALPASLTSVGDESFANNPSLKLSIAKKNETFEIVDGALVAK